MAPILAQFDSEAIETRLEADASRYAVGRVLMQRGKGDKDFMRPVTYFSKKMNGVEANYPIHDKEMLAIIKCLQEWDAELRSVREFTILTDHRNLKYFLKKQRLNK